MRSKEFSTELLKIWTNFFVSNPREESYREVDADKGVPDRPEIDIGLARDDRAEEDDVASSECNNCKIRKHGKRNNISQRLDIIFSQNRSAACDGTIFIVVVQRGLVPFLSLDLTGSIIQVFCSGCAIIVWQNNEKADPILLSRNETRNKSR